MIVFHVHAYGTGERVDRLVVKHGADVIHERVFGAADPDNKDARHEIFGKKAALKIAQHAANLLGRFAANKVDYRLELIVHTTEAS